MGDESSTIPINRISRKKIFVGIPIYGAICPHFFAAFSNFLSETLSGGSEYSYKIKTICGDSLIPRARNGITRMFLESDCTHLLFIDSDLVFTSYHIERIMSHGEDLIGGFYQKKKEGHPDLVCNILGGQPVKDHRNLVELKYVGTGFMCISRKVFEAMIEAYGKELAYKLDDNREVTEYDFWRVGVYNYKDGQAPRYLSEDWYFCQMARDLGFKVWGDSNVVPRHIGVASYPLSYQNEQLFSRMTSIHSSDSAAAGAIVPQSLAAA